MEKYRNVLHAANNLAAALEEAKYSHDALEHALEAYGPTKATLKPINALKKSISDMPDSVDGEKMGLDDAILALEAVVGD